MRLHRFAALAAATMLAFTPLAVLAPAEGFAQPAAVAAPAAVPDVVVAPSDNTTVFSPDTVVTIPTGDWLDTLLANSGEVVLALLGLLLAWASRRAPRWLADIIRTVLTEQLLSRAVTYGTNAVRGAVKDQRLDVNVGSQVVAEAAQYAIDHGPEKLIAWAGGAQGIKEKVLARIPLAADATAAEVLEAAPPVTGE